MSEVPTITVRWPEKFGSRTVIINANDFNEFLHERVDEPAPEPLEAPAAVELPPEPHHKAARSHHKRGT